MQEDLDKKEANKALYISGAVIALLVIGLITNGFGLLNKNGGDVDKTALEVGAAPTLGDIDAPLTIYEFSDFSCPACAMASGMVLTGDPTYQAPLPLLKAKYVETGKVRLVFKYFPGHGTGSAAHQVGWCLNEQGLFWTFHDAAFANQDDTGNIVAMKDLAKSLGADVQKVEHCISDGTYLKLFQEDPTMGRKVGVRATPTFIIDGEIVEGAVTFSELERVIQRKL